MPPETTGPTAAFGALLLKPVDLFLSPGSLFWAPTLAAALAIAAAAVCWRRVREGKPIRIAALRRALLPKRLLFSASGKADIGLLAFNMFAAGALIGWAMLSGAAVGRFAGDALAAAFGPHEAPAWPLALRSALVTAILFLAYELGYWLDHYLSHRVAFLWAFHKVHHTAEALSPVTVFRMHPIDTLKFVNILALVGGGASGLAHYALGHDATAFAFGGANIILLAFMFATIHLQHSHVWIAFRGPLGRVLLSPAHHQIHHSDNPAHYGKNLGSCLSLFDWLFGTLHIPAKQRERLRFGVAAEAGEPSPHSVSGVLTQPFAEAFRALPSLRPRRRAPAAA